MATSYTQRKAALDEIANNITGAINNMDNAKAAFTTAKARLDALATTYGTIITEIGNDATANPSDAALVAQKAEADKLVDDFIAQSSRADALISAVAGI